MSCKYILNGKQYTEKELLNLASSASSLMSVRTRSNDEMIRIIKEQTGNRFVNLDLFTPYQETVFIGAITTDIVGQIGTLKPGRQIKLSPSEAFLKTKAKFENSYRKYEYLAKQLDTNEKLAQAKTVKEYLAKFPELESLETTDDIELRKKSYKDILDNFDGFTAKVKLNLRKFGLKMDEGSQKFSELKMDEEYYKSLVNNEADLEQITEEERLINESYEDGSTFMVNPRDTASTRVKLFFATVPSTVKNALGVREFVSYDDVIENFLEIGSELETVNYDTLQSELMKRSKTRPYLKNVMLMLAELKSNRNTSLLNEILTFTNKAFQEQVLVKWDSGPAGVSVEIIKSNRNTVVRQIYNDWLENQKIAPIITSKGGQLVVDSAKAAEFKTSLAEAAKGNVEEKKKWVKSFLQALGIDYSKEMLDELEETANNGGFRKNNLNMNFAQLFLTNNMFSILVEKYNTPATENVEVGYEDANNAMKDEFTSFSKLAEIYYQHTPGRYHTGSTRNGENKSIYSYINPSFLERVKKKMKYSTSFLDTVLKRSFAKSSNLIKQFKNSKDTGKRNVVLDFFYADSLKQNKKNRDGVVRKRQSPKEQLFEAVLKHQNRGATTGYYNIFTLSDKTVTPVIHVDKYKLNDRDQRRTGKDIKFKTTTDPDIKKTFDFGDSFKSQLYNLAESEINRIVDYSKKLRDQKGVNQANFDKAFEIFYLFPVLNRDDARMQEIRDKMYAGEMPDTEEANYIKDMLADNFKEIVVKGMVKMIKSGLIKYSKAENGTKSFNLNLFDVDYLSQPELNGLTDIEKLIYSVTDFKFNYLRAQVTSLQLLGADPALFYKEPAVAKGKSLTELSFEDKLTVVKTTMDEFSKRAAMFIAPGSQGVWNWYDKDGNVVDRSAYRTITISDVVKDTELFKDIETTDAQEFITLQEHIDRMMSEGRIPLDVWQSITDRLNKKGYKPENFELTEAEKQILLQPAKPVHTNSNDLGDGFSRVDYVKSSTFPLIADITRGTALDDLRVYMEKNNVQSANFKSAKKVGQPGTILNVFDKEGNFTAPTTAQLKNSVQTLKREGLHTQQEIPLQKEEISNMSQANRVLFDGLLDVKDFKLDDNKFTGREFKELKENIRISLMDKAHKDMMRKLGIEEYGSGIRFKNKKALEQILKDEAIERGFSLNDIAAIKITSDGRFVIPPYLMARGEKFEGLINSLVSKIVQLKNPGTSLVQVSGVATKLKESELNKKIKNDIIWLPNYDASKGLQYMRRGSARVSKSGINEGKVLPAQVIVSQFIRDEEGNLIDLSKFITEDPTTGRKMLDTSSFSEDLFHLVASRIPNQGHASMLPIEVVGFLPSYMENTIIVPDGITKQMGSDFDVDKLYAYLSSFNLRYDESTEKAIESLEKEILNQKNITEAENTELYTKYLSKQELATIKQLKEDKNEIVKKLKWNISAKEKIRKQKSIDNINKLIEGVYENIKTKYADEYLKIRQQQLKNKTALDKKIADLKEEIKTEKAKGIVGVSKVSYDLSNYASTWESLDSYNEDQLHQMYKDLHWSVLTHPAAFDKIAKSIDYNDIKDEVKIFDKLGLFNVDQNYSPMDIEEQIQIFNDNRSGKVGVGIFASLGSFLADNQDKDIFLGKVNKDGKIIKTPVIVLDDEGNEQDLHKLTEAGSVGTTKEDLRTKGDNNSIMLSESVDNAKNKNLFRFNFSEETMGAVAALISLSDSNGSIVKMNFATRFFKQRIIEDYVDSIQTARDSLSEYVSDVKNVVFNKLRAKYTAYMSEAAQEEIRQDKQNDEYKPELFSPAKLLNLIKEGQAFDSRIEALKNPDLNKAEKIAIQKQIDAYIKKQLDVLDVYERLDDIGKELTRIIGASYIYTKGLGSSVFSVMDSLRKLSSLNASYNSNFVGLNQLAGGIKTDLDTGRSEVITPRGEIGHSIVRSLHLARDIYKELYPVHFSNFYNDITGRVFNSLGVDKINIGSERFIKLNKQIIGGIRSYLFSSPSLQITDNIAEERRRLIMDSNDNKSLAKRILEARDKYPELQNNYFFKRLGLRLSTNNGGPSQVYYNSPFGDIDEIENNKGYLSLIFSGIDEQIQLAKDLAVYTYVTGGNQTNSSFGKFIPIEYFISDEDFVNGMEGLPAELYANMGQFQRQLVQNNPDLATRMNDELFSQLSKIGSKEGFSIDTTNEHANQLIVDSTAQEQKAGHSIKKFSDFVSYYNPQDKTTYLYERTSPTTKGIYKRINTLGTRKSGFSEYDMSEASASTLLPANMVAEELANHRAKYPNTDNLEDLVDTDQLSEGMLDDINLEEFDDSFFDNSANFDDLLENMDENPVEETGPKSYTNYSGGAAQADSIWDEMGRRYGVENHVHFYDASSTRKPPKGNTPLNAEQMKEGIAKVKPTYLQLGRPDQPKYYSLHGRNWFQVKNADAVFAVSDLVAPGEKGRKGFLNKTAQTNVEGGTGYAVQMAINEGKDVYVYHQDTMPGKYSMGWYKYNRDTKEYDEIETPVLTKNFAGIGTSDSLTEDGLEAIEAVYKKTFASLSTTESKVQGIEISSDSRGLGAALTNPTELARRKGNLTKSYPVRYGNRIYKDVEEGYQDLKSNFSNTDKGPSSTYALMVGLIKAKLSQHPELVEQITQEGGSDWIMASTHQPTSKNTVWETGGKNWFIEALNEAYKTATVNDGKVVIKNFTNFTKAKEAYVKGEGIWSMRPNKDVRMPADKHYGNPWSTPKPNLAPTTMVVEDNATAIQNYRDWVNGTRFENVEPARRQWIADQISSGELDGKTLIYYKPGNYVSHADVLAELVNTRSVRTEQEIEGVPESEPDINIDDLVDTLDINNLVSMDELDPTEVDLDQLNEKTVDDFVPKQEVDTVTQTYIPNLEGSNTLSDVLNRVYKNTKNSFYKNLIQILSKTDSLAKNIPLSISTDIQSPGEYSRSGRFITINPELAKRDNDKLSAADNLETVIMHEAMHAYTENLLSRFKQDPNQLNERQRKFAVSLKNMFADVQKRLIDDPVHGPKLIEVLGNMSSDNPELTSSNKGMYYGLTNLDEFVSMIMTDRRFQQFMNSINYKENENISILDKFKDLLKSLLKSLASSLGIKLDNDTALYNGVNNIVGLITEPDIQDFSQEEDYSGDPNEPTLDVTDPENASMNPYMLKTPGGLAPANDEQVAAIDRVSNFLNSPVGEKFDDNVFLLYGPGGTGKTASVANAIAKAKKNSPKEIKVSFAAISHTAKGELIKAGNKGSKTFASLVGSEPEITQTGEESFKLVDVNEYLKAQETGKGPMFPEIYYADWIVIDEASMIGDKEISALKQRLNERASIFGRAKVKFLFMGDYAQIPPIGLDVDKDGYAINLMKNTDKSVGLSRVMRTKNQDITDLGFRFRRAIDYYNTNLDKGIPSAGTKLTSGYILKDIKQTSENVLFTGNFDDFFNRYIEQLKANPYDSRHAIMINYNNERHKSTIEITNRIRKGIYGDSVPENEFLPGEPVFLDTTIFANTEKEIAKNTRVLVKSIQKVLKSINVGTKFSPEIIEVPMYKVEAYNGKEVVNFEALDKQFSTRLRNGVYDKNRKGYLLDDGTFFLYRHFKALQNMGIVTLNFGYLMSSHKVQGQTYNHSFVHELNIHRHVKTGSDGGMILSPKSYAQIMYTAVSRAKEKVYMLTDESAADKSMFVEPKVKDVMKSASTVNPAMELPAELELENQCK